MTTSKKKKIISYASLLCSLTVVVFAVLQLCNIWDKALYVAEPMMAVLLILQGVQHLNKSKAVAIFLFISAAIIFAATGVVIFMN